MDRDTNRCVGWTWNTFWGTGENMESVKAKDKSLQCSAEGHVSHIYSDRMSSRPLGWSRNRLGELADMPVYGIPHTQIKKIAALKNHIWGL